MTEQPVAIDIRQLGRVDYLPTYAAMQTFTAERDLSYTSSWPQEPRVGNTSPTGAGIWSIASVILMIAAIAGMIFYHSTHQEEGDPKPPKADPLFDLKRAGYFIKEYVFRIEEAVIRTLLYFGVTGHRVAGAPGIYVRLNDPTGHTPLPQRPQKGASATPDFTGLGKIATVLTTGYP